MQCMRAGTTSQKPMRDKNILYAVKVLLMIYSVKYQNFIEWPGNIARPDVCYDIALSFTFPSNSAFHCKFMQFAVIYVLHGEYSVNYHIQTNDVGGWLVLINDSMNLVRQEFPLNIPLQWRN